MASNALKPDNSLPMGAIDHAAMGHDAKPVDRIGMGHAPHGGGGHAGHGDMVSDFRRRLWVCLVLTVPVLVLSPMVRDFTGQGMAPLFAGEEWFALALSSIIYFWGGWPCLKGALPEIRSGRPGMMTLVALAISTAYFYSAAVTFGLPGGRAVLLGTGYAHDHYAARALAGDALGSRRVAGAGGTGTSAA